MGLIYNNEGLKIYVHSDNEELLKHPEVFKIFTMHPIYHYYDNKGEWCGGEVIMAEYCFKNCVSDYGHIKYDIILDYSNIIWKRLFNITNIGNLNYEEDKEKKISIYHFDI